MTSWNEHARSLDTPELQRLAAAKGSPFERELAHAELVRRGVSLGSGTSAVPEAPQ